MVWHPNKRQCAKQNADYRTRAIEPRLKSRGITIIPVNFDEISTNYKQADRGHLNPEGHRMLAEKLLPEVIAALGASHSG